MPTFRIQFYNEAMRRARQDEHSPALMSKTRRIDKVAKDKTLENTAFKIDKQIPRSVWPKREVSPRASQNRSSCKEGNDTCVAESAKTRRSVLPTTQTRVADTQTRVNSDIERLRAKNGGSLFEASHEQQGASNSANCSAQDSLHSPGIRIRALERWRRRDSS